jgi:hypothetical protein
VRIARGPGQVDAELTQLLWELCSVREKFRESFIREGLYRSMGYLCGRNLVRDRPHVREELKGNSARFSSTNFRTPTPSVKFFLSRGKWIIRRKSGAM